MAVSTATANAMLGGLPSTLYVQLHSGDPGASGTANVLVGPGRGTVSIPSASGGQRSVSSNVDVPGVPASATVSHVSYWDAASGGTFQMSQPLGVSVSFLYAGTLRFTSQVFTLSTSTGSSQTQTSVTTDATTGTETVVTRSIARVTDTSSSSDTTAAFSGVGASDSGSFTETVTLKFAVVVSDTSSTAEVINASQSAPSDTTAPVVTDFTVGTPSGLTVTIATFTATDAVGVTGYMVTTSATPPGAGDAGWAGTAPLTWTASSSGTYSLYPWAKDSAGNVSSVFGTPRSVTVSSGGPPGQYLQGQVPGVYGQGIAYLNDPGGHVQCYRLAVNGDDGEGSGATASVDRVGPSGALESLCASWPLDTWSYVRLEHDSTGGGIRIRRGNSASGPWTTVWSGSDTTYSGGASTNSPTALFQNFSSGTY